MNRPLWDTHYDWWTGWYNSINFNKLIFITQIGGNKIKGRVFHNHNVASSLKMCYDTHNQKL